MNNKTTDLGISFQSNESIDLGEVVVKQVKQLEKNTKINPEPNFPFQEKLVLK